MDSWNLKWLFIRIVFVKKKLKLLFQFCTIHFLKSHHCFHIKKPSYLIFEVFYKSTKTWLKSLAYCTQLTIFVVSFLSNSQVLGTLWVLLALCWASPHKMLITGKNCTVLGICFPINSKVPIIGKRNQNKGTSCLSKRKELPISCSFDLSQISFWFSLPIIGSFTP